MNYPAVMVQDLTKIYGPTRAVDGIGFEVQAGEVFGLLGPNGAGKTTTLECIEGLRAPTHGIVRVCGLDPIKDKRRMQDVLGVQLQSSALPEQITAEEAMAMVCAWHGCKPRKDLLERFHLAPLSGKRFGQMSTGQQRRLQLALALAGSPKVVVMDEPTAGVDVQGRAELHKYIRELKSSGITLLLATHDMAEAQSLCDRIAILIGGKVAVLGTPEQVTSAGSAQTRVTIKTAKGTLLCQGNVRYARFMKNTDDYALWLCSDTANAVMELLRAAMDAGDTVEDLRVERPTLEERFIEIVVGGKSA